MTITMLRSGNETKKVITSEPLTTHHKTANKVMATIAANQMVVSTITANGLVATSGRHTTNREVPTAADGRHRPQH